MKHRIFIVEDHPVIREAYKRLIRREPDLEIYGEAETGTAALVQIAETRPDLILLDVTLPDMSGIEVLKRLKASQPEVAVLIVSGQEEDLYARPAILAGARGYLDKFRLADVMTKAIRQILQGGFYVSEQALARLSKSDPELIALFSNPVASSTDVLDDSPLTPFQE